MKTISKILLIFAIVTLVGCEADDMDTNEYYSSSGGLSCSCLVKLYRDDTQSYYTTHLNSPCPSANTADDLSCNGSFESGILTSSCKNDITGLQNSEFSSSQGGASQVNAVSCEMNF